MTILDSAGAAVSFPGEPSYDAAAEAFNLTAVPRPVAAVTAGTVDEVRAAIRYALAEGLPMRVHSTGHASAGVRPVHDGLLIRTRLRGPVEIDAARAVVRIPAGTRWGKVVEATAPHGMTVAHGSSASVGAVGYLLGGGMSFYGRTTGVAANTVRAIELVTASGDLVRADAGSDPELFWALRGGGGGFGIVTAIEVAALAVRTVVTGAAWWPGAHAEAILRRWRDWTRDAPRDVTTSLRLMNLPPVPEVPAVLRGRRTVCVDGAVACVSGDPADAQARASELLTPLRAVAEPVLDTWSTTGVTGVLAAHMDPDQPLPVVGEHMLLGELDDRALARFLEVLSEGSRSPLIAAGLRQLGGAYAEPIPTGGALDHLDAAYSYAGSGVPMDDASGEALRAHCRTVRAALSPWDTGRTVPSFVESFDQPQRHLDAAAVARVDRVRRRVDPEGLFRGDIAPNATALY